MDRIGMLLRFSVTLPDSSLTASAKVRAAMVKAARASVAASAALVS
jgi:hypothetical protein